MEKSRKILRRLSRKNKSTDKSNKSGNLQLDSMEPNNKVSRKQASAGRLSQMDDPSMSSVPVPSKSFDFDRKEFDANDFDEPMVLNSPVGPGSFRKIVADKRSGSAGNFGLKSRAAGKLSAASKSQKSKPTPVIVVTDIGADIDDTLALFVLLGATDAVKIVAVVTSCNNGLHRGAVTRGFLRLLGIPDGQVEILPSVDGCVAGCYIPDSFPSTSEAAMGNLAATPRRIVEICKEHKDTGIYLYGIGTLSPIAEAIKMDMHGENVMQQAIRRVYLQGQAIFVVKKDGETKETDDPMQWANESRRLLPSPEAYNFKNDMDASRLVFEHLQDVAPFTLLGKHAAYRIPITKGDFSAWTHKISAAWKETKVQNTEKVTIPNPPDLLHTAKKQMRSFRQGNPEKFDQIYKIPGNLSEHELDKFDWFDTLPSDYVCSHPYDPLLALAMVQDIRKLQRKQEFNVKSAPALGAAEREEIHPSMPKNLFQSYHVHNINNRKHNILGNIPERHAVPDVDYIHQVLVDHISKGLRYHGASEFSD